MRKIALCLLALPFLAVAGDEFSDKAGGIVINVPDGWDRDSRRERGAVRFSANLSIARSKYVLFEISAQAAQFEMDEWIAVQKSTYEGAMKSVDTPFKARKDFKVGGKSAGMVVIGGKRATSSGTEYGFRARIAGVQNGSVFLTISELSFNGAHEGQDAELKGLWDAIRFQAPEGELDSGGGTDGMQGGDGADGEDGEDGGNAGGGGQAATAPTDVDDKAGNLKVKFPAGWLVIHEPQEDGDVALRVVAQRLNDNGDAIGELRIWRFTSRRAETFTLGTPSDFLLENIDKNAGHFEKYYGDDTKGTIRPDINEGVQLGGAEKSGEYVYSSITAKEEAEVANAEKLKRRGEKIEIPEFKEIEVRGRIALISPHIYFTECGFRRSLDDETKAKLWEEYKQVMESWEFASVEGMPSPLSLGSKKIGNTIEKFPEARKSSAVLTLPGRRAYKMTAKFTLPPGIMQIEDKLGANTILAVVAQDSRNSWVRVLVSLQNHNQAGERNMQLADKKTEFTTWASNFESKARGVKVPSKPQSVRMAVSGKGYKKLEGTIEGHRGTFSAVLSDKGGWRYIITVETRGEGDRVFEKPLKTFFKKLKFKAVK